MRINFLGKLVDEKEIRAGFIGCGSHSFRNVYPTFQYAHVHLVATCDLVLEKATAFAAKFGAKSAYSDYREMLAKEQLDAVFIVVGYDKLGRPLYPDIAVDCMNAGAHVWMEKPPAATCADIEKMQAAARKNNKQALVGCKKMFFPANEKAKELISMPEFGKPAMAVIQYPQRIATVEEMEKYLKNHERIPPAVGFLDHLCHPASTLIFLMGMPKTLFYERTFHGSGAATFAYENGAVANILFTHSASLNGGMERTLIVGDQGRHVVVDNNIRVTLHRNPGSVPGQGYGNKPNFFTGTPENANASWEPEFSLGQLYNKQLFLLGYWGEVEEFALAVLGNRPVSKCHLEHAWQITRIFEAFAEGPGKVIKL